MDKIIKLNRFTTLPILLDFLTREKLVLLDPNSWDDKNDTEIILEYKKKTGTPAFFALCFTHSNETIHHWKTFANGAGGCCIEFNAGKLIEILNRTEKIRHGAVKYKRIHDTRTASFGVADFPFIKRKPYEFEREYRVIWEGTSESSCFELDVPLSTISRITFSQQMPEVVLASIKQLLVKNFPALKNRINRSTLYKNETWINHFKK